MKVIEIVLISLFLGTGYSLLAQSEKAPKYSNEFLQIGVGADALAKANAVVASCDNVMAGYWNPAGLMNTSKTLEVGAMHSEYFAGIAKYDYLGVSKTINDPTTIDDKSAFGLSIIRFAVDDIPNTTQLIDAQGQINYDRISTFTASDFALILSYARMMPIEGLNVGGNFKIIRRKVGDFAKSWGFGIDAAAQYKRNEHWKFGVMWRDVTTTFNAWMFDLDDETREVFANTGNELPQNGLELTLPRLILGAHGKYDLGKKGVYVAGELDLPITFDGKRNAVIKSNLLSIDPCLGLEVGYKTFFAFRMGLGNMQQVTDIDEGKSFTFQPNIGFGLSFKNFFLDYAFTDLGDQSVALYSHVVSLRFKLERPEN